MKLGLLGCGSVAYWLHLRALRGVPEATLVAAADPDPAARARFAKASGVTACEGAEELLGRGDIEAVLICAPTHLHATLACAAAAAGKHFYLEKPIATSVDDARHVVAAAARVGITTAVGFNRRHHPLFERARALLMEGTIGRVHAVQTTFCEPSPPDRMPEWKRHRATGGGVLLDLASHHIDQVRWMLATEVDVVSASVQSEATEQDGARLELTTDGGAAIQSFFSFRAGPAEWMEFIGERGTLQLDRHAATLALSGQRSWGYGTSHRRVAPSAAHLRWLFERIWHRSADPSYRRALRAFVEQVREGRPGTATLHDGLRSLEVVVAAEALAGETCASY
jgi:myo-inositol 2-dehydrogenase / D-chiro-inositol 1-dehydrogenase